jgi:hypothetical protein
MTDIKPAHGSQPQTVAAHAALESVEVATGPVVAVARGIWSLLPKKTQEKAPPLSCGAGPTVIVGFGSHLTLSVCPREGGGLAAEFFHDGKVKTHITVPTKDKPSMSVRQPVQNLVVVDQTTWDKLQKLDLSEDTLARLANLRNATAPAAP